MKTSFGFSLLITLAATGIVEGRDLEHESFNLLQMLIRITNVQLTENILLLVIPC
jgi:CHASE1-domain containing sensor protein